MNLASLELDVNYTSDKINKLEKIAIGDWIDLRAAKDAVLKAGESALIPLGVRIRLPEGYEAHVAPRSSTFKTWGIIQTNSIGVIDCTYTGEWMLPVYATRDTEIHINDRICQFRLMENQPRLVFLETSDEEFNSYSSARGAGGFGSTGHN